MKNLFKFALFVSMLALVIGMAKLPVLAAEANVNVTYLEDGSYYVEEMIYNNLLRAGGTKSGSKSITFYNSVGVAQWKEVLSASFSYTGNSASAKSASCTVTIYVSAWSTKSKSENYSSNSATSSATMNRKVSGIVTQTETKSLKLTCDKNGKLS